MARARVDARNFFYGVMNGVLVTGADALMHSALVIAPFLALIGAPAVVIGLVPAIRVGGYFLPQLLVANRLSQQPYKLPVYNVTSSLRIGSLIVMTAFAFFFGVERPALTAAIVLIMLTVNAVASGISGVPFADVTAKIVPHRRLGTFWVLRNVIGGALALLCGWGLRAILASDMSFPGNFGLIFLLGTILYAAGYVSFSFVKEPAGVPGMQRPLLRMIREIPTLLRLDANLRRFLRVRFLGLAALLAEPFYAVYAIGTLGAPESALGIYIIVATAAGIIGNFALRKPADSGHNVTVLQIGLFMTALAPLLALLSGSWQVFGIVFVLSAMANQAINIAAFNLLYAIASPGDRPLYIGLSNTVLALPSLAPVLAGALLPVMGVNWMFAIALALGVVTMAFSFRFKDLREADRAALTAQIGGDEEPPSPEVAEIAEAVLTPKVE